MRQGLTGVAVFILALIAAVGITKYYGARRVTNPSLPVSIVVSAPTSDSPASNNQQDTTAAVSYKVQFVTLDLATKKSHTTLVIERARSHPAPEKLWVGTCIFAYTSNDAMISPCVPLEATELSHPFAGGDTVTVTADAPCPSAGTNLTNRSYYARVKISTLSGEDARPEGTTTVNDISSATPVVVQEAPGKRR